jgi:DNA-binding NarL/FixJ family response regulator
MNVFLVAGEPLFRLGFRTAVESSGDLNLVGDVGDARSAFVGIDGQRPDVVVMDICLPGMNGISATRELKRRAPEVGVLLLSAWGRERDAIDGLDAGASGFALKTDAADALLYAVRAVGHGHRYLSPELRGFGSQVLEGRPARRRGADGQGGVLDLLSPREREVLDLVLKGWRNRVIARELCVSVKTVDTHRTRINRKLHCSSASDLIRFAADNGLLRAAPSGGPILEAPASASDGAAAAPHH